MSTVEIKNRFTGAVIYSCELPEDLSTQSVKPQLGFAVRTAVKAYADLRGADLSGVDLSGVDLSGVDLSEANLRGVDLRGVDLSGVDLSEANLRGVDLRGVDLRGVDLRGVDLSGVDLSGVDLRGVDLSGVDLSGVDLRGVDLRGVDLREANLSWADLRGAAGFIDMGHDPRGYHFYAVRHTDGWRISAGCRWFTLPEAIAHWTAKDNRDALARVAILEAHDDHS